MKALQAKRNNLRSLWRRSLVILSIVALVFALGACNSGSNDDDPQVIYIDNTAKGIRTMSVTTLPTNPSFQGCPPDLSGMEILVTYTDGTSETVGPANFFTDPAICENAADGNNADKTSDDYKSRLFDLYYHGRGAVKAEFTVPKVYPLASVHVIGSPVDIYEDRLDIEFSGLRFVGNYWNSINNTPTQSPLGTQTDPASSNSGTVFRIEHDIPIRADLKNAYMIGVPGATTVSGATFPWPQRVIRYKIAENDAGLPSAGTLVAPILNNNNINKPSMGGIGEIVSPFFVDVTFSRFYEVDRIEYVDGSANFGDTPLYADELFLTYTDPRTTPPTVITPAEAWMTRLDGANVKLKVFYKYLVETSGYVFAPEATREIGMAEYIYAWKRTNAADPEISISPTPTGLFIPPLVIADPLNVLYLSDNFDLNMRLQYFDSNIKGITTTPIAQATYPNAAIIPLTGAGMIYQFTRFEAERRTDTLSASNHQAQTFGLSFDDRLAAVPLGAGNGSGMDKSTSGTLYDLSMSLWTYWKIYAVYSGPGGEFRKEISRDAFLDAGMYGREPYGAAWTSYTHHINSIDGLGVATTPWSYFMSPASQSKIRQLVPGDGEIEDDDLEMNVILPMSQQRNYLPIDIFGVNVDSTSLTTPYYSWPGWSPNGTWEGGTNPQHPVALTGVSPLFSQRSVGPASIGGSYLVNADMLGRGPLDFTGLPGTKFTPSDLARDSVDLPFQKLP